MSYAPQITPVALDALMRDLVLADPRVKTFRLGDFLHTETYSDLYPAIIYEFVGSKIKLNTTSGIHSTVYSVRLYAFDQRVEGGENVIPTFSLTQTVLTDLLVRMAEDERLQELGITFDGDVPLDYVVRDGRADVCGTSAEIRLITPIVLCPANLPQE